MISYGYTITSRMFTAMTNAIYHLKRINDKAFRTVLSFIIKYKLMSLMNIVTFVYIYIIRLFSNHDIFYLYFIQHLIR